MSSASCAVDASVCAGDRTLQVVCVCFALTVSEGLLETASEDRGLKRGHEVCGRWDIEGCICFVSDSAEGAWDVVEAGSNSVDTPDMRSAAATAPCLVGALFFVQLLAKPANAVVEDSEAAASKLQLGTRLPASEVLASDVLACVCNDLSAGVRVVRTCGPRCERSPA